MKEVRRTHGRHIPITYRPSITKACFTNSHHHIYSPRILGVKWSASWGTWTCRSLTRSSVGLWSSRPLRSWRRTRWPTTPASQHLFLITPSLPSWEKVHHCAPSALQSSISFTKTGLTTLLLYCVISSACTLQCTVHWRPLEVLGCLAFAIVFF